MMMIQDDMKEEERPIIHIVRVRGPLFVCEDPSHLLQRFPQMHKKHYGGTNLSIEELEYLSRSCTVTFAGEEVVRHHECLRERHGLSCRAYRYLTGEMGLFLRHGSQFGAAFIGYKDISGHGGCLIYLGPLSPLATVAAVRVACSVSKEAWVVEELHDGGSDSSAFFVTKLASQRGKIGGKRQRREEKAIRMSLGDDTTHELNNGE